MDLGTVKARDRLKPRREPYWHKLTSGQYLGFRPSAHDGGGTWIARFYDADRMKQVHRSLGDFGHLPASERFGAASTEARAWFAHLIGGGSHEPISVREVCERYALVKPESGGRFQRYVYAEPIAKVLLHKLTDRHLREWRRHLEALPAKVTRNKRGMAVTRERQPATVNRDMVALRAALNKAFNEGEVLSDLAWRQALKPLPTHGRRTEYLDRDERRRFLAALPSDAASFARGLCLLPIRPGALASLRVQNLDIRKRELVIIRDKSKGYRTILLPADTAAALAALAKNKSPGDLLFTRSDGMAWNKDKWKRPVKAAVRAAGLPDAVTAYTLRHSTITDLVTHGLDLLTVAQVSGTSVAMIEKHYGHLRQEHAATALATLNL
ncbi:MAG: tyrosine-type recombinase/integrase [Alphaproteobacteria bacterium]|nr:tyrosine-type recombinase/integrase [Alphaproteobacteria bacterium]